ncbi:MAG: N-acetylmuramoyl-L-alanine amidase [Planctomycetota bacterium]|nr:N-acetylmuramoyl-L-alanine amidase [Planctomycetota bacterium]
MSGRTLAAIFILATVLISSGCGGGAPERKDESLPVALHHAQLAFDRGELDRSKLIFSSLASPEQSLTTRGLARLGLGRCALKEGQLSQACRQLELSRKLLSPGPNHARALLYLGEAQLRSGATNSGLNQLERAYSTLAANDEKSRAAFLITRTLDHLGQPVAALYRNASQQSSYPEYSSIWIREVKLDTATARNEEKPTPVVRSTRIKNPNVIRIQKRNTWKARPVRNGAVVPMTRPFRITVHNTADQPAIELLGEQSPARYLRRIQDYCTGTLKWGDIGYHYLISSDGRVWEGRSMRYQGAHAGNNSLNRGNIGIALIGNYDRNRPSTHQLKSLRTLLAALCNLHDIAPDAIAGHQELRDTTCPGRHLQSALNRMVKDLAQSSIRTRSR